MGIKVINIQSRKVEGTRLDIVVVSRRIVQVVDHLGREGKVIEVTCCQFEGVLT